MKEKINYEKTIEELEKIVEKMEEGNLSLDEMLSLYEKGTALSAKCNKYLDAAQLRIREFTEKGGEDTDE